MIKRRGICAECGAKKYLKFLTRRGIVALSPGVKWYCISKKKCRKRSSNYGK